MCILGMEVALGVCMQTTTRRTLWVVAFITAFPVLANADQHRFVGIHPAAKIHGGFCYIEAPHVHRYKPGKRTVLYRPHAGHHHFVGDPVAHGFDGPKHTYSGHHPIDVSHSLGDEGNHIEFCYIDGPHYHAFVPAPTLKFASKGNAYWYIGDVPSAYRRDRVRLARINAVYKPMVYTRPIVTVDPPSGWISATVYVPSRRPNVHVPPPVAHGRVSAGIEVAVPTVSLEVGLPSVHLGIGGHVHASNHVHVRHKHRRHKYKRHKHKRYKTKYRKHKRHKHRRHRR